MAASTASTFSSARIARVASVIGMFALVFAAPMGAQARRTAGPKSEVERGEIRRPLSRPAARPAPARAPGGTIFFCTSNDVQCRTSITAFDLDSVRDLFVFAAWRNVSGEHTQRLRFVLPDGNTYQVVETRFTTAESAADTAVRVAVTSREEKAVATPFAVAGTHITQRSLSGTWTVELYLDGKLVAQSPLTFNPRMAP